MKRCFSTVACMNSSTDEIIKAAVNSNMQGIEVRLDDDCKLFGIKEKNKLSELREKLTAAEIEIVSLGTSVDILNYNTDQINKAKKCIDIAALMGIKGIRIFLGNFTAEFSEYGKYDYDGILAVLKEICKYAKSKSVEIWIETHNEFSTGKVLKKLYEDVGCDNLKIIWDIIHPIEMGETPSETIGCIKNILAHVHIKDGVKPQNEKLSSYIYTKLGEGELPIAHILLLLKEADYKGYISLEWESAWRENIKNIYKDINVLLVDYNNFIDSIE